MDLDVSEMDLYPAAKHYTECDIIVHPLYRGDETSKKCRSPGKQPILSKWQKLDTFLDDAKLRHYFKEMRCNLGAVCGEASDLTVIDIDWTVKGLWEDILQGIDRAGLITQQRKEGKHHIFFRYNNKIKHKLIQELGFDLLNDRSNIVLSPSVHPEGQKYVMVGNVADRPEMPDIVADRINEKIELYEMLSKSLSKCRHVFGRLWNAVFVNKKHTLYHDTSVFRSASGRRRTLALFAELKKEGATDDELRLASQLMFGDQYDEERTSYEISQINPEATAKNETIKADDILREFYSPATAKNENKKLAKNRGGKVWKKGDQGKEGSENSLYPYILTPKGVGKFQDIKDPEDPSKTKTILEHFLYTPAYVSALSDDLDGEQILYKIGIDHPINGHIDLWKDQGELLTRSGINKLLSEGLIGTDSSYKDITKYFMKDILRAAAEAKREFIAHKTGWKRDNTIFVAGNEAYTTNEITPVNLTDKDASKSFMAAGELDKWADGCSWILQHDSTRINCYTVFSSVIAGLLQQPSPILQNKGLTTTGKTLKSACGASMIGNPFILVKSADTTRTAAEREAIATDGTCSVLDEVGMLKNPDGLIYLLSNGRKKQRGTKEGREETANWFKSFILNGEFEFLKESSAQGEIGRLIECSWQLPRDAVKAKATESCIKENYGHITPLFFKKLFSKIGNIKKDYERICSKLPTSELDIGARLRDSFALIVIAGEILEEVFEDMGIEKKDAYSICEKLYLENITSERVKPYWIRGLSLILDEVNACKPELDGDGEETGRFLYKGQMGGDTFGVYIDIHTATFRDMCDKYELKHTQLMQDWRDKEITEVDKSKPGEPRKSQKTVKENGTPKKVIRLIKNKVYEALEMDGKGQEEKKNDLSESPKYDRETLDRAMLKHDLQKHMNLYQGEKKTDSNYVLADSFFRENPGLKKHYTIDDMISLIKEIKNGHT